MIAALLALVAVIAGLLGQNAFLQVRHAAERRAHDTHYAAWDVERGRYVAALLSQSKAGDLAASSVVRPKPAAYVPPEPKPVQIDM